MGLYLFFKQHHCIIKPIECIVRFGKEEWRILNFLFYGEFERLYELLKCKDGESSNSKIELEFEVDELRQYFDCEKKYQKISQFKEKVINTAVREINEKSDLWVNPTYKKTGRAITSVVFETHANYWNIQKQEK